MFQVIITNSTSKKVPINSIFGRLPAGATLVKTVTVQDLEYSRRALTSLEAARQITFVVADAPVDNRTEGAVTSMSGNGRRFLSGTGTPEAAVVGSIGDLYTDQAGGAGTTLYVKESGNLTNTGWIAK